MDPGPRPANAEMDAIVAMLQDAGLVEVYVEDDGHEAYRLTEDGVLGREHARAGRASDAEAGWEAFLGIGLDRAGPDHSASPAGRAAARRVVQLASWGHHR